MTHFSQRTWSFYSQKAKKVPSMWRLRTLMEKRTWSLRPWQRILSSPLKTKNSWDRLKEFWALKHLTIGFTSSMEISTTILIWSHWTTIVWHFAACLCATPSMSRELLCTRVTTLRFRWTPQGQPTKCQTFQRSQTGKSFTSSAFKLSARLLGQVLARHGWLTT